MWISWRAVLWAPGCKRGSRCQEDDVLLHGVGRGLVWDEVDGESFQNEDWYSTQ